MTRVFDLTNIFELFNHRFNDSYECVIAVNPRIVISLFFIFFLNLVTSMMSKFLSSRAKALEI